MNVAPGSAPLMSAMGYAVLGSGKRIRPVLSLRIARLLGALTPVTMQAAISVELFHAASLIIDDLPCMDDDDFRRGQPSVHRKYGEATAILAAFGLVSLGARSLIDPTAPDRMKPMLADFQRRLLAVLDCSGLLGGQALDLGICGPAGGTALATELKTAPLFELSARAGTLAATISDDDAELLHRFGRRLGIAFQLVDDVLDGQSAEPGAAVEMLQEASGMLRAYGSEAGPLHEIVDLLRNKLEGAVLEHYAA